MRPLQAVVRCVFVGVLIAGAGLGQTTNGSIAGTITDPGKASVADVQVQATNRDTGLQRSATSLQDGTYVIPQLPPGRYDITVQKAGFAKGERHDVQLLVNQSETLDFSLSLATEAQAIVVTEAAEALNTTTATISSVVQHQAIVDLPLNGRSFTQLTLLAPGAAPQESGQQGGFTVKQGAGAISPSVNGQRLTILKAAVQGGVVDSDLHYLMAECLLKLDTNDSNAALNELNRALELNANSVSARTLRGKLLLRAGRAKEAVSDLELAIHKDPDSRAAIYNLAGAYRAVGRTAEADALFRQLRSKTADTAKEFSDKRLNGALGDTRPQH
jgi:tetratricopeptide (TPR) repeat protein